jgi:GNAT superfamily N-acetyltransferase
MNCSISFTLTKQELDEIEKWLIEERDNTGDGFYCNWTIIENFYARKELAIISVNDHPVGFACWRKTSTFSGQINIFEIKPDFRGQGLGTYFTNKLLEYFVDKTMYALDVQCVPETSESFWRRFDFIDVPANIRYWDRQTIHLFKILVPCEQEVTHLEQSNYIEMWDFEPYGTKNRESKWKWNFKVDDQRKLSLPIIRPCEKDWRIKCVEGGKVIIDDKIKRFGNVEIDYGPYAIITELPIN